MRSDCSQYTTKNCDLPKLAPNICFGGEKGRAMDSRVQADQVRWACGRTSGERGGSGETNEWWSGVGGMLRKRIVVVGNRSLGYETDMRPRHARRIADSLPHIAVRLPFRTLPLAAQLVHRPANLCNMPPSRTMGGNKNKFPHEDTLTWTCTASKEPLPRRRLLSSSSSLSRTPSKQPS